MPDAQSPAPAFAPTVFDGPLTLRSVRGLTAEFADRLTVNGGLEDCRIEAYGVLHAPSASLVGGTVSAAREITVGLLGEGGGTATEVILGLTRSDTTEIASACEVFEEEHAAMTRTRDRIALLERDSAQFDHAEREALTLAMFDLPEIETSIDKLESLIKRAREKAGSGAAGQVEMKVMQTLHVGVTLRVYGTDLAWACTEAMSGPVKISMNDEGALIAESDAKGLQILAAGGGPGSAGDSGFTHKFSGISPTLAK